MSYVYGNDVRVTGGHAKEREIAEAAIYWCIKKLLPKVRTLDIDVKISNCDAYGYCLQTQDHKTFEIEVNTGMRLYDFISTICHEMVHVKQFYRKQLCVDSRKWKSKIISKNVDYENQPWEKEAFKAEGLLALECFQELDVNLHR